MTEGAPPSICRVGLGVVFVAEILGLFLPRGSLHGTANNRRIIRRRTGRNRSRRQFASAVRAEFIRLPNFAFALRASRLQIAFAVRAVIKSRPNRRSALRAA